MISLNSVKGKRVTMNTELIDRLKKTVADNEYISEYLGIKFEEIEEGRIKAWMVFDEKFANPYGGVHGGILYSLADIVTGTAACTFGAYASTVNGSLNYLKPAINTKKLHCLAECIRQGKTIAVYRATIMSDAGDILACGDFTFAMMHREV